MSTAIVTEERAWTLYELATRKRTQTFNAWKANRTEADWNAYRAAESAAAVAFTAWCNADDEATAYRAQKYGYAQ